MSWSFLLEGKQDMFKCKCCLVREDENKHLRGLVDQLLLQVAPKPDPSDLGALPLNEVVEEEFDDEGRPIVRDKVGL